jgi:hypothetical protein
MAKRYKSSTFEVGGESPDEQIEQDLLDRDAEGYRPLSGPTFWTLPQVGTWRATIIYVPKPGAPVTSRDW